MKAAGTLILFFVTTLPSSMRCRQKGNEDEIKLMDFLFKTYDKSVRPTRRKESPVNMTFGLAYVQMVQLDDREQTLISNVWVRQKWVNQMLQWNPKDFNNISRINIDPKKLWLPDIVLYNNAKSGVAGGTMYQFKTKVVVEHTGLNTWYAPTIIRSSCNIDITFFPFDDQFCELNFGSWTFNGHELDIFRVGDSADLASYLESTEFDLVSAKAVRKIKKYSCCAEPYPNIIFTIHLQRQPGFFLFNVIIPSMVITFFAIITFSSPHQTGERISLAIESFLSLSFLCMMVSDNIPVNSDVSPLITKFLIMCMILISGTLVLNLVSMNLHGHKPVPYWLRRLAFNYLAPCVDICPERSKKKSYENNKNDKFLLKSNKNKNKLVVEERIELGSSNNAYRQIKDNMRAIVDRSTNQLESSNNKEFWRCVAQTIDRICMCTFTISFVFVSAVMMLKGYGHQLDVLEEADNR